MAACGSSSASADRGRRHDPDVVARRFPLDSRRPPPARGRPAELRPAPAAAPPDSTNRRATEVAALAHHVVGPIVTPPPTSGCLHRRHLRAHQPSDARLKVQEEPGVPAPPSPADGVPHQMLPRLRAARIFTTLGHGPVLNRRQVPHADAAIPIARVCAPLILAECRRNYTNRMPFKHVQRAPSLRIP